MTITDLWDLLSAGGLVAALLLYAVLSQREDIVPGRTYRREIERAEKANAQAERSHQMTERLLAAIETIETVRRGQ